MTQGKSLAEIALELYAMDPLSREARQAIAEFEAAASGAPPPPKYEPPFSPPFPWGDLPRRKGRYMRSPWKIAVYWEANSALGKIDLEGQPYCLRCLRKTSTSRWPGPWDTWDEAGRSLDRAHLIDRSAGGLDGPQNIVLLCRECHGGMPSFEPGDEDKAIEWVIAGRELRLWTPRAVRAGTWPHPDADAGTAGTGDDVRQDVDGEAPPGEPLTHFFHCWRFPAHHACAVALIERQAVEYDELLVRAAAAERAVAEAARMKPSIG